MDSRPFDEISRPAQLTVLDEAMHRQGLPRGLPPDCRPRLVPMLQLMLERLCTAA